MNDNPAKPDLPEKLSEERIKAMQGELKALSRLNAAMFRWVFSDEPVEKSFFAAMSDKTDPEKDGCQTSRSWDISIQGDFYLLRRLGPYIYIIVGDAAGHHAYAGGLKVFVVAALRQVFDRWLWFFESLTAAEVLTELRKAFFAVGKAALEEDDHQSLDGGANVIVVRIDSRNGAITYSAAGLPVFLLGPTLFKKLGDFSDGKGIAFPKKVEEEGPVELAPVSVPTQGVDFLAFITDGFRDLRRSKSACDATASEEIFGDGGVEAALTSVAQRADDHGDIPAIQVASNLVDAARKFRRNHVIPEHSDDDRLIVVVDLRPIRRLAATSLVQRWLSRPWSSNPGTALLRIAQIVVSYLGTYMIWWGPRVSGGIPNLAKLRRRTFLDPALGSAARDRGGGPAQ